MNIEAKVDEMHETYDVIVAGSGLAGLYTALRIREDLRVLVVTKKDYMASNSYLAQGGIACVVPGTGDTQALHKEDTMVCGHGSNNREAVRILVGEGFENILALEEAGVAFDREADGSYALGMEGAHSRHRILHCKDHTGKSVLEALYREARSRKNIRFKENTFVEELLLEKGVCRGVAVQWEEDGKRVRRYLYARTVVMATGGIGKAFGNTTNDPTITGDGIAMAHRAKARLRDMEKVQFHPTVFQDGSEGEHFLISEAVRGEGAYLRNAKGKRFMGRTHPQMELAPRDVVSQAIFREMEREGSSHVWLDATHFPPGFFREHFPTIHAHCMERGIDPERDWIPVAPMMHYFMGGIEIDLRGNTSVPRLYACGECANTGVHGHNRLASNSLLEALVFANRIAAKISMTLSRDEMEESRGKVPAGSKGMARTAVDPLKKDFAALFLGGRDNRALLDFAGHLAEAGAKARECRGEVPDQEAMEQYNQWQVMEQVARALLQEWNVEGERHAATSTY
ncbi:L-aspartate oxidase [Anaerotalea alkaliphila]|uniref:L-aspartate oxidase n=1 Tax=Anaerotalea alkaliphila TaxID=2662126 RepID=A0A7X5HXM8_9FIRM|nr:L-aspartate oxidase [Anaerotalea alkaliphila]NDL68396.1 L-aspartate oxidase [Anaerotalea alkaliphila]